MKLLKRNGVFIVIKPKKLNKGDKVAIVSLSNGIAGDELFRHRYEIGKRRIEEVFGLEVIEMENALKGSEYLYKHPKDRAEDMMEAFMDEEIKAIFSNIGGEDTIRLLPYIDFDIIENNPKIFMGYSDTTVNHFMCYKAGLVSFYGPSVLGEFAENISMHDYTKKWIDKVLFQSEIIGKVEPSDKWTSEHLEWGEEKNNSIKRKMEKNSGYELLQGEGKVQGKLIGGCIEVLEVIKGTELWPGLNEWENAILFLETSEDKPEPGYIKWWLRNYAAQGILDKINGIIIGKPKDETYYEEYKEMYIKVIREELGRKDLPILYNMNFGHTSPMSIIPLGVSAEIDCDGKSFSILDSGVIE